MSPAFAAANLLDSTEFLVGTGLLIAVLLAGAVVVWVLDRWRKSEERARAAATESLSHFRTLFENGENHRIRIFENPGPHGRAHPRGSRGARRSGPRTGRRAAAGSAARYSAVIGRLRTFGTTGGSHRPNRKPGRIPEPRLKFVWL